MVKSSIVCRATPAITLAIACGSVRLAGCRCDSRSASLARSCAPQPFEPGHLGFQSSAAASVDFTSQQPHPAVARIVVPEGDATSYGSGTLVDVRDQYGLVVTNWHVVRDGTGEVEVIFPDGFRSKARPLKVDADWDLAALVIWRPTAAAGEARGVGAAAGRAAHDLRLRLGQLSGGDRPLHAVLRADDESAAASGRTRRRGPAGRFGRAHF